MGTEVCLFCVSEVMTAFGDFVFWKAIDCEFNSAALCYNCLASDCFVIYYPVSIKFINVFFSFFFFFFFLGTISTSE